jgi:hypothetical protein
MRTIEERFWPKVDKSGDCWEWTGSRYNTGYGMFWIKPRCQSAHRFSWELHFGPIPNGLFVLHTCDTRHCIRPDHLFLGTQKDNVADAITKGRVVPPPGYDHYSEEWKRFGERSATSKLTDEDVRAIRKAWETGTIRATDLSERFKVSEGTIRRITKGLSWVHVT